MFRLRDYTENDIPYLVKYLNDDNTMRYLTSAIPQPYTLSDAEFWVKKGSQTGIVKAIELDGSYIGDIGAVRGTLERSRSAEIGYWIGKEHWGKGAASFALDYLTNYIFETTNIIRLHSQVLFGNEASCRVLEKCDYKMEGILEQSACKNNKLTNSYLYAKVKN